MFSASRSASVVGTVVLSLGGLYGSAKGDPVGPVASAPIPAPPAPACVEETGRAVLYVQVVGSGGRILARDPERAKVEYKVGDQAFADGAAQSRCFTMSLPAAGTAPATKVRARAHLYKGAERSVTPGAHTKPSDPFRVTLRPITPNAVDATGHPTPLAKLPPAEQREVIASLIDAAANQPEALRVQELEHAAALVQARPGYFAWSLLRARVKADCTAACVTERALAGEPPFVRQWLASQKEVVREEDSRARIRFALKDDRKSSGVALALAILEDGSKPTRLHFGRTGTWGSSEGAVTAAGSPFAQYDPAAVKAAMSLIQSSAERVAPPSDATVASPSW